MGNRREEILKATKDLIDKQIGHLRDQPQINYSIEDVRGQSIQIGSEMAEWADSNPEPVLMIIDSPSIPENITIDQRYRFEKQIKQLEYDRSLLIKTLKSIADEDYRGNRSHASIKAYNILKELGEWNE